MNTKYKWTGTDHPINKLPAIESNVGCSCSPYKWADYVLSHKKHFKPRPGHGQCAKYVAQAFKAAGLLIPNCPYSACQYVHHLPVWGFRQVASGICERFPDNYIGKIGDVCVLASTDSHPHGHIAILTSKGWCSDWIYGEGINPYEGEECMYQIFRWTAGCEALHTDIEMYKELSFYFPEYTDVRLQVTAFFPGFLNKRKTMSITAALTRNYRVVASPQRIVGMTVTGNRLYDNWHSDTLGTVVIVDGKVEFLYDHIPHEQLSLKLNEVAQRGGIAFQQYYWIYDGHRESLWFEHDRKYHFRALTEIDGRICIIESRVHTTCETFKDRLEELGIRFAANLDTGRGWQNAWFRQHNGKLLLMQYFPFPFNTNKLVFKK